MATLVGIEIKRLLARRLFRAVIALSLLGIVIAGIVVFFRSRDEPPPAEVVVTDPLLWRQKSIAVREESSARFPVARLNPAAGNASGSWVSRIPTPDTILAEVRDTFMGTAVPLAVMAWLLGASFIGAEWQKGTMATTLLWAPRRIRLLAAKALACCVTIFVVLSSCRSSLRLHLLRPVFFGATTEGNRRRVAEIHGGHRGGVVAVVAAMIGFSIAGLGRNTAAALGVGFLYMTVIEGLVRGLRLNWVPWLLADNAAVFITDDPLIMPALERSTIEACLLIAAYATALAVVGALVFRRRDSHEALRRISTHSLEPF